MYCTIKKFTFQPLEAAVVKENISLSCLPAIKQKPTVQSRTTTSSTKHRWCIVFFTLISITNAVHVTKSISSSYPLVWSVSTFKSSTSMLPLPILSSFQSCSMPEVKANFGACQGHALIPSGVCNTGLIRESWWASCHLQGTLKARGEAMPVLHLDMHAVGEFLPHTRLSEAKGIKH